MPPLKLALALILLLSAPRLYAKGTVGDVDEVEILRLHPTQLTVGLRAAMAKAHKIEGKSSAKRAKWLKARPAPVVLGPGGALYLTDHHHLARAAWEAGEKRVFVAYQKDLSSLSPDQFWAQMKELHWVHLYDQDGKPAEPSALPADVRGLLDDPYRSIAGAVRDGGCYDKGGEYFAEFKWADYFRARIPKPDASSDYADEIEEARALAVRPEAGGLPGYRSACKSGDTDD